MSKTPSVPPNELLFKFCQMHIPQEYLSTFDLYDIVIKKDCYELILHEKESQVPAELKDKSCVLDGFCDPISILSGNWLDKKVYLVMKRRRWKAAGSSQHFSNTYTLHPEGAKITPPLKDYLKKR